MKQKNRKLLNEDWGASRFLTAEQKLRHSLQCMDGIKERAAIVKRGNLHAQRATVRIMHFDQKKSAEEIARALKQDVTEIKILIGKMRV